MHEHEHSPHIPLFVFVSVHARGVSHVGEYVLKSIRQLESVYVAESVLDVAVNYQFGKSEDFPAEVKCITESGLLSLFGCKSLDRFEHEVVVEMEVV